MSGHWVSASLDDVHLLARLHSSSYLEASATSAAIFPSTVSSNQPFMLGPIGKGGGKSPERIRRQRVVRDHGILRRTSSVRMMRLPIGRSGRSNLPRSSIWNLEPRPPLKC